MTTGAKFPCRQLLIADVEQEQRLHAVDYAFVAAVELILDHIKELAMQTLDEIERFQIAWTEIPFAIELFRD